MLASIWNCTARAWLGCRRCYIALFRRESFPWTAASPDFTSSISLIIFLRNYQNPVLVSCTDGVGTKLKVAQLTGKHDTVGIDLVAMSVNDALCCGAEPLFFLDYVAMSHDDPPMLEQIVQGISVACLEADCSLLGGETAIMPDLYARGDYDLAGFCVGVVERNRIIDGKAIADGDLVIGVASSGLHSNGYSLARKIVFDIAKIRASDIVDDIGGSVCDVLMTPTRIYVKPVRHVLSHYRVKDVVHGIAHITGGGLLENLGRIIPENRRAIIRRHSWPVPPIFTWLQKLGEVEQSEMDQVFNGGIGLVLVASPYYADSIRGQLADCGLESWQIGHIADGPKGAVWG